MLYRAVKFFERLSMRIKFLGDFYTGLGGALVEREISVASITFDDNVLHIGCGSFPYTSEIIARETGARVTAIDCDNVAVEDAKQYIDKKKLASVKIEKGNGMNYPFAEFDVIVVAHGVQPKEAVLRGILHSMKKGARLIYRNPKGILGRLYNNEFILLDGAEHIRQKRAIFRQSILVRSVLVRKK